MPKKKNNSKHYAMLKHLVKFRLKNMPPITAYLDTGYSKQETINIIRQMYKNRLQTAQIETWDWMCGLFKWMPQEEDEKWLTKSKGVISFSTNWNNKLNCTAFTTIRIFNPKKYEEGEVYKIEWDGNKNIGIQNNLFG